jgi:hypothetical protein
MPLYSSHLLQLLDVAYFSPLKRKYSDEISALACSRIYYISKETFLPAFKATFKKVFTLENARAGFRGARLVLYNLEAVLLKLNVRLRTPPLTTVEDGAWEAKTPRNAYEIEAQLTLIRNCMQNYRSSLVSSLDKQVKQLSKGAQQIAHNIVLIQEEIGRLRDVIKELIKHKSCKRQYVRVEETLTVSKVSDLIAKKAGSSRNNSGELSKRVRLSRRCGTCGETGHNSCTCKVEIEDVEDSDRSE